MKKFPPNLEFANFSAVASLHCVNYPNTDAGTPCAINEPQNDCLSQVNNKRLTIDENQSNDVTAEYFL
jgi:hypothetical protein